MNTSDFDYDLPTEYIAQMPVEPRDCSRLLVLDRSTGEIQHCVFHQISDFLRQGDLLVINETRVIPARLFAEKLPGRGRVELLLLKRVEARTWEVMVGGSGLRTGRKLVVESGPGAEVIEELEGPRRVVRFDQPIEDFLRQAGHTPLPPYIRSRLTDSERYQTVYARRLGSTAAPTAGLHFTPELIENLRRRGIGFARLDLRIGLDTFAPVDEDDPREHTIHTEWCQLSPETAGVINRTREAGGRIVAVGTTSVRTLESAAQIAPAGQAVAPFEGPTSLFILPGYPFKVVDALVTNFHLPRSTLIMLVSAFAGRETVLATYEVAKRERYRFYSFGDAMLII